MKINLRTIPEGSKSFEFILEKGWWKIKDQMGQILGLETPLKVKITIENAGKKFVLSGTLLGCLKVICDRCLVPFSQDLNTDFREYLSLPQPDSDQTETEIFDEDMNTNFIKNEEIDLDAIIREQIFLSLPMQNICKNKCQGLCSECGQNLNLITCNCERKQGHPELMKLKKLIIKGE